MPKGDVFINDLLKLIFNATAIADLAENDTSGPLTSLYVSLHTASPAGGTQATSEVTFTNYLRHAVLRQTGAGGWTAASAKSTSPVTSITFPASGGTPSETISHFAIGTTDTGNAGKVLYSGTVTPNITMNAAGITAQLTTATTITEA